jgi:hypothetical protein
MSSPIVRMYSSPAAATAAVKRLTDWGFDDAMINMVTAASKPPADAPRGAVSDDPVLSAIMSGYVLKAHAKVYAEGVRRGQALVSVLPPFGRGSVAESLLDEARDTVDTGVADDYDRLTPWDEYAPLSSALKLPPLVRATAPLSAFLVAPVIIRRRWSLFGSLGVPEVTASKFFVFGEPSVSRSRTPLSSALGLPLLWKK